ncbi:MULTISPECIES: AAA family ATPase [unclassified Archaeoglobus]|jgi:chromosome segregation ATPase|uniref:AAA family ATPase n=1 Tax=unclassified Archaeoglobus TaxID=2643606 RepID=UPI0025B84A7D|nr:MULTISPECIES: AAA family ATPase [unclassified Archaeoglobus]
MYIKMENIGGLESFEAKIEPNKVTYIIAPNTAGKTSFVRGLQAVFAEVNPREVINISKTKARIVVSDNGKVSDLTFQKTPTGVEVEGMYPDIRDPRASLISFILPDSKVVQDIILKDGDLRDFLSRISKADEYKKLRDEVKKKLTERKEMLEVLRKSAKEVPKLREIKSKLEGEISELRKRLEEATVSDEAKELQAQLNKLIAERDAIESDIIEKQREKEFQLGKIDTLQAEIEELQNKIKQLEKEIPELKFEPIIERLQKRADEVREKIAHEVRPELNKTQADVSKLTKELEKITKGEERAGYCPFDKQACSRFTKEVLETILEGDKKRLENLKAWYEELNKEYKKYTDEIRKLKAKQNEIVEINRQISQKIKNIREIEDKIDRIDNEIRNLENEKELKNEDIKALEDKIKELVTDKDQKRAKIEAEIAEKTRQVKEIERRIAEISKQFDPEKSVTELEEEWMREIEELEKKYKEYSEIYERQLYGEAKEFNKRVNEFLKILGFDKNFHRVLIDPNTQKLVVYKTPTESQPLNTLSTSERYALAILIMLIAREIYIPEFPLIVLDEVLISFDEERGRKVLEYIRKEVPYVITTALKDSGGIEVKSI